MRHLGVIGIALALPMGAVQAQPAVRGGPAAPSAYVMPATQMWDMPSAGGDIYRIFVSVPTGKPPEGGYPVLYVLDGNAYFASFAETRRLLEYAGQGNAIVVGVGYPTDSAYHARRTADFLYPVPHPKGSAEPQAPAVGNGRDKFLDFLTGTLRAELGKRYRIDPDRQSLFGHSFGGLFALHALYARPQAFQSIVSASPSLEWNMHEMLGEERDFAERLAGEKALRPTRLMLVVGGRDTDDDPERARALATRLDRLSAYGLATSYHRYEEETHMTVPVRSVTDTLRFVFR